MKTIKRDEIIELSACSVIANLYQPSFDEDGKRAVFEMPEFNLNMMVVKKAFTAFNISIIKNEVENDLIYYYTDLDQRKYESIIDLQRPI